MLDAPFDVFAVMIAIAAFLIALKASNQATELRRRLGSLEAALQEHQVQPPPLVLVQAPASAPATGPAAPTAAGAGTAGHASDTSGRAAAACAGSRGRAAARHRRGFAAPARSKPPS